MEEKIQRWVDAKEEEAAAVHGGAGSGDGDRMDVVEGPLGTPPAGEGAEEEEEGGAECRAGTMEKALEEYGEEEEEEEWDEDLQDGVGDDKVMGMEVGKLLPL